VQENEGGQRCFGSAPSECGRVTDDGACCGGVMGGRRWLRAVAGPVQKNLKNELGCYGQRAEFVMGCEKIFFTIFK
jgi:hypothetical protein